MEIEHIYLDNSQIEKFFSQVSDFIGSLIAQNIYIYMHI